MNVTENESFSKDYHDPEKRSIANCIKIVFKDGTETDLVTIEYPIGHKRRREEGVPVLLSKFKKNLSTQYSADRVEKIVTAMNDTNTLSAMKVSDFMALWLI